MGLAIQLPRFALVGIAVTALHALVATALILLWSLHRGRRRGRGQGFRRRKDGSAACQQGRAES